MLALALAAVLSSTPSYKLATPGLTYANLDEKTGSAYLDYFTQQIAQTGRVQVTTPLEVTAVMGLERQRQMMACSDASGTCIAELAGALGADALITGSLARVGKGFLVNLKVISTRDARMLAVYSSRARDEDALIDYLAQSAKDLVKKLVPDAALGPVVSLAPPVDQKPVVEPAAPVEQLVAPSPEVPRSRAWLGAAAVGGALVAGGAVSLGLAHGAAGQLSSGSAGIQTPDQLQSVRSSGEVEQGAGVALIALGGLSLAASAGMMALTRNGEPARNVWWVPAAGGAASAVVSGILFAQAKSAESSLRSGSSSVTSLDQAGRTRSSGAQAQAASFVTAVGAAAGVGAGLALKFLGSDVVAGVAPSPGGAALTLGGTL